MAQHKAADHRKEYAIVRTTGIVLPDGCVFEPIAAVGDHRKLELAKWDGLRATTGTEFEHGGKLYQPAALDPTFLRAVHLPTHVAPAEPARDLLAGIGRIVNHYTGLAESYVTLFGRFSLSTWFPSNITTARWLSIVGPDAVRRTQLQRLLRCFSRRALPIGYPGIRDLAAFPGDWRFTLLIEQPKLSREAERVLHVACGQDAFIFHRGRLVDVHAPCVTLTDAPCQLSDGGLQAIEIPANPDLPEPAFLTLESERQIATDFQPRMLRYFFTNHSAAMPSVINLAPLSFAMREVARDLTAITPGDEFLQAETVTALTMQDGGSRVTRWADDDTVLIESLLFYCHDRKEFAYVGEIAEAAEKILIVRGESKKLNAKVAGTKLRLMQFIPEPRDRKGFRLKFTDDVKRRIHRLAEAYDVPAVQDGFARCEYCTRRNDPVDSVGTVPPEST